MFLLFFSVIHLCIHSLNVLVSLSFHPWTMGEGVRNRSLLSTDSSLRLGLGTSFGRCCTLYVFLDLSHGFAWELNWEACRAGDTRWRASIGGFFFFFFFWMNECQHLPPQAALSLSLYFLDFLWLCVRFRRGWGRGQGRFCRFLVVFLCFFFFLMIRHSRIEGSHCSDSITRPVWSCRCVTLWQGSVIISC